MTSEINNNENLRPVNEDDKSSWPTIGCRIRRSELFLVDRAVMEVRHRTGRLTYSRSDFIAESVVRRAMKVLEDTADTAKTSA